MGYKWVTVTGDGGKTSFKISQSNGRVWVYNGSGSSIGETRSLEDAISLIKATYGKTVWSVDIGEETSSCFSADSLILTSFGYRAISELRRGDQVISICLANRRTEIGIVTQRIDHPIARIWEVRTGLSAAPVCTTAHHPFLTARGWILSQHLRAGQTLIQVRSSAVCTVTVKSVTQTDRFEPVHNLITAGAHNFVVQGLSVHNFAFARNVRTLWHRAFIDPWVMSESGSLSRS